jgi:histidinol phosphatase-like PHP family hydrolase
MKDFVEQPSVSDPQALGRHMLKFFISAAESGIGDILSHPFFPYGFIEIYDSAMASISDAELFDACSRAAAKSVGIEINLCYFPNDAKDNLFSVETPIRFISIAKEAGCRFTFGSDAHSLKDLKTLERLQYFIDTIGIEASDLHPLADVADA